MNNVEKAAFAAVLILATQSTRLFPLVFKEHLEKYVKFDFIKNHLGDLIILFLIFYCYRDFSGSSEYLLRLSVGIFVFLLQWHKDSSLLSIFSGTALYMTARIFLQ